MTNTQSTNRNNVFSNMLWAFGTVVTYDKLYMIVFAVNSAIKGLLPVLSLLLMQNIIDCLQNKNAARSDVIMLLLLYGIILLIGEVVAGFLQLYIDNTELKFSVWFQNKVLSKVAELSPKKFEESKTYDLISRVQFDADTCVVGSVKISFFIFSLLLSIVSYAIILLRYNCFILIIIALFSLIRYYFEKKYNLLEYNTEKNNTELNRKADYIVYTITHSEQYKEIKLFDLFGFFTNNYVRLKDLCNKAIIDVNARRTKASISFSVVDIVFEIVVIFVIMSSVLSGNVTIGLFVLYCNSIDSFKTGLSSIFFQISLLYKNSAMVETINLFFDIEDEKVSDSGIRQDEIYSIELKNVYYKYSEDENYVLKNINLKLDKNSTVILMGHNGSGKSTLVKIIMGIYDDYEGEIYVNGINLRLLNLYDYRKKVSALFQDYIEYETSVYENILYGNLSNPSRDNVKKVLGKIGLSEFKEKLNMSLGYQFNEGKQISVGQWQKMALGRSIYKDAEMYIFDEPNSSIDMQSEYEILSNMYEITYEKITVIIMHRFNFLCEKADKIIVLDSGEITEIGSHCELMKAKGYYYNLYDTWRKAV